MAISHLARRIDTGPPALQTKDDMNPTLLVSWFCTIFSLVVITIRLLGRWVRTEKLFKEDKVMSLAIIPLLARMGLVHAILIWGTNQTVTDGLTTADIHHRQIGSKLVLVSRIMYAAYIWIAKVTVVEFLRRIVAQSWIKSYEIGMRIIYGFLALTYVVVVISTLAECQPFDRYWQVIPDPGYACRSGITQLLTMGICDIITDVVLIVFPIPLVIVSTMPFSRKVSLTSLFLLSIILIIITAYRIPSTIHRGESQQYRSLLASLEILAATGVSNAVAIGSFVRDRGVKKAKFRALSVDETSSIGRVQTRSRSVTMHHWGSDEDLVRDLGLAVQPSLRHSSIHGRAMKPAPIAMPDQAPARVSLLERHSTIKPGWTFSKSSTQRGRRRSNDSGSVSSASTDIKLRELNHLLEDDLEPMSPGAGQNEPKMGFFDVGGLIDKPSYKPEGASRSLSRQDSPTASAPANFFLSDVGGLLGQRTVQDDEIRQSGPFTTHLDLLRGSKRTENFREFLRSASPLRPGLVSGGKQRASISPARVASNTATPDDPSFSDAGGLLS